MSGNKFSFLFFTWIFAASAWADRISPIAGFTVNQNSACIWNADSVVKCWGPAYAESRPRIIQFNGLTDVKITDRMGCAIDREGVWCWGTWGGASDSSYNRAFDDGQRATSISLSSGDLGRQNCLIDTDGQALCWSRPGEESLRWGGKNSEVGVVLKVFASVSDILLQTQDGIFLSRAGDAPEHLKDIPFDPASIESVSIANTEIRPLICAIGKTNSESDTKAWCNENLKGLDQVVSPKQIATNEDLACVVDHIGKVQCFEREAEYHRGNPVTDIPIGIRQATSIALGVADACVLDGGSLRCWGQHQYGSYAYGRFPSLVTRSTF